MMTATNLAYVMANHFTDAVSAVTPLGNGLINDTFLVTPPDAKQFVLQRINRQVFPEPELITANLLILNQHSLQQSGLNLLLPAIVHTKTGAASVKDEQGECWRAQSFIADTDSLESLRSLADAAQVGDALGRFHRLCSSLDPGALHDTLPGFHVTPAYLSHYQVLALQTTVADPFCAEFIRQFQARTAVLETAKHQGRLRLRVIHGDPKLNNFLFAKNSSAIVSLIDLDTVKPGLVHYDIGDCLRSCCHNLSDDSFDLAVGVAILQGYLREAGTFFTADDYHYLYAAIELLPFELGLRFYSDYLQGNRYFKVTDPEQNLRRARAQFRLCTSVMAQQAELTDIIRRFTISL